MSRTISSPVESGVGVLLKVSKAWRSFSKRSLAATTVRPKCSTSTGCLSISAASCSHISGLRASSPSRKNVYSPEAFSTPAMRVRCVPIFGLLVTTRMRASCAAACAATSPTLSGLASFTTIASISEKV